MDPHLAIVVPPRRYRGDGRVHGAGLSVRLHRRNGRPGDTSAAGPGGGFSSTAEIAQPGGFLTAHRNSNTLAGVVLLALWAIAAAGDYSTGLIRILVQAQPNRINLLSGKILALTMFTLLTTLTTTLAVVLVARPLARLEGIETEAWKTDFVPHLLSSYFNFAVAGLV